MKKILGIYIFLLLGSLCLLSATYATLDSKLDAYYTLDNTLTDATGTHSDLTNSGTSNTASGLINEGRNFSTSADYLDAGFKISNSQSFSFWVNTNDDNTWQDIFFSNNGDANALQFSWDLRSSTNSAKFYMRKGGSAYGFTTGIMNVSQWQHVVMVYNESDLTFKTYINGIYRGGASVPAGSYTPTNNYRFGTANYATQDFNGIMDEIAIFDDALNENEILNLYNSGLGSQYPWSITPQITANITDYYNSENISIQLNTTSNVNMSYVLDDSDLIISDGLVAYYQAENNANDRLGVNNGTEYGGVSYTDSVNSSYGKGFQFDGVDDYIQATDVKYVFDWDGHYTFSAWILCRKDTSYSQQDAIFQGSSDGSSSNRNGMECDVNAINFGYYNGITWYGKSGPITLGVWTHVVGVNDGGVISLYINGNSQTSTDTPYVNAQNTFRMGWSGLSGPNHYFNGSIDDVRIYNRALNSSEITQLYETSPYYTICEDCNNSVLNLEELSEGLHDITLMSSDINGFESVFYNFSIDTINPTINNTIPTEINTYNLNISAYLSCSDTNLDSCSIYFDLDNKTSLSSNESYTFTYNGNQTYTITAVDLAGNQVTENGTIFINPYNYFQFTYTNGTQITDYTLNGTSWNDTATYKTYDLGLGETTLLFEKLGFASTNISFTLNTTNQFNNTYNISNSKIIVKIYDRETEALITELVTITLIATTGYNTTTTTGQVNISDINFISELYQIIASSQNYTTESIYFNYNNQENLNVNIYMLSNSSTDSGYITIQALSDTGYRVQNAICNALEWKPSLSAYQSVAEGLTNINGETNLNIEIGTKLYKFSCTKDSNTAFSSPAIISATGQTLPIILVTTISQPQNLLGGVTGTFVNTTYNSTHDRLTFTFADSNSLVSQGCIKTYSVIGTNRNLLSTNCLSSDSGEIQTIVSTNNTYKLIAIATVVIDTQSYPIDEPITYYADSSYSQALSDYHLDIILPLVFVLLAIVLGLILEPQNIYISQIALIIAIWFSVLIVPSVISVTIALFITAIVGLMIWGGLKPK